MVFHEIYGTYFQTVSDILKEAVCGEITGGKIRQIIRDRAFEESGITIPQALTDQWHILTRDGRTPIRHAPRLPLTDLQKMWMKSLLLDPRIRLFDPPQDGLEDVEPLFEPDFFFCYDRYSDGDPFEEDEYREHFRLVLLALREKRKMEIVFRGKQGRHRQVYIPDRLEYSSKDDKFRLASHTEENVPYMINLARIRQIVLMETVQEDGKPNEAEVPPEKKDTVVMELTDERNALERAMLHFSDLEKETVKLDDLHYRITLSYRRDDETELLIRILSFGPQIRVTAPDSFIRLIRQRLNRQKSYGLK